MLLEEKIENVRNRIRIARLKKNYTQDYVGNRLFMTQRSYHRLENGKSQLKVETLLKLAVVLEVKLIYFFDD